MLSYIIWNPSETLFQIGSFGVRWYSMFWLIGLTLGYFIVRKLYKDQKLTDEQFEPLFIYCFLGILIGARLGHCLFYEPDVWLSSWQRFIEIFIPIRIHDDGSWKFVGYQGLASHGGTLGLMIALWLYCKHSGVKLWQVLDNIAIATPLTACCIRLGNLMNSEIVGKVTNVPWAFIFVNGDPTIAHQPRHPGQLYEAMAYFCFFFIGWWLYQRGAKTNSQQPNAKRQLLAARPGTGFFFGLCLTLIFSFRFFIEYTKEAQVDFESGMLFNMGQLLSVPFILIGIWSMRHGLKQQS